MKTRDKKPFQNGKIPVCNGLSDLLHFAEHYPDFYLCPYVADKTDEGWDSSTSRVYMNQVLAGFLYVPVNVPREDVGGLAELLSAVKDNKHVAAVNITQPHKSNPVIKRIFAGSELSQSNIDTLIRNRAGELRPYDLNASAFIGWYKDEVGEFTENTVVIVGVGGVGESIAKAIAKQAPTRLLLIDPNDKRQLAEQLGQQVESVQYFGSTAEALAGGLRDSLVLINAAGKEGADGSSGVTEIINRNVRPGSVFVDIRPQLEIDTVETAKA